MRIKSVVIVFAFFAIALFISSKIFQPSPTGFVGPHNGIIKQAGYYYIEIKTTFPNFYAFLLDEKQKPVTNKGISCQAQFDFIDGTTSNIKLKPFGDDGFYTGSYVPKYSTCIITFSVFGKQVSARFENETLIVKKTTK